MSVFGYDEFPADPSDWLPEDQFSERSGFPVVPRSSSLAIVPYEAASASMVQQRFSPEWTYDVVPTQTPAVARLTEGLDPDKRDFVAELAQDLRPDTQERLVDGYVQLSPDEQTEISEYYLGMQPGVQELIRRRLSVEDVLGAVSLQKHEIEAEFQATIAERCRLAAEGGLVDGSDEAIRALYERPDSIARRYAEVTEEIITVETAIMQSGERSAPFLGLTTRFGGPSERD